MRSIALKKAYSSDFDNILDDFYIPALRESVEYSRLAGLFSSASLAVAARGILGLIENGGFMRLIACPRLSEADVQAIVHSYEQRRKRIEAVMLAELDTLEEQFVTDHVRALAWLIVSERLDIRVAIPHDGRGRFLTYTEGLRNGLFHQKVGVMRDAHGHTITFSGSLNETACAWLGNIEEFKVFRGWELSEAGYVEADVSKFERFWSDQSESVLVMDVPRAVEERLVEMAPREIEAASLVRWRGRTTSSSIELFDHQKEAVDSWVDSGMRGILEMATGTGKTFAALGCLDRATRSNPMLFTVITCPYQHLVQQWVREIGKFGTDYDKLIVADSSNPGWKHAVADSLIDISLGHKRGVIVLTTHRTFSSDDLVGLVGARCGEVPMLLIADEVHGVGAIRAREGLVESYDFRLGLSATPRRWFDAVGTAAIFDHFGETVYEFPLERAITTVNPATGETYLAPYRYVPEFVSLTEDEMVEYVARTNAIARLASGAKSEQEEDELVRLLLFKRADIIKSAGAKYGVLETLLDEIGPDIRWTIVYCSPQQIDRVMEIINARALTAHRFTMDEGTTPERRYGGQTERDYLLRKFAEGQYQILVAMRCLDEGVDVPPARTASLMASSGNPREHIQRIGRVIRRYPGKHEATIHDILVVPSLGGMPAEMREIEWRIFQRELVRSEEIAAIAINNAEALEAVYDVKRRFMEGK